MRPNQLVVRDWLAAVLTRESFLEDSG